MSGGSGSSEEEQVPLRWVQYDGVYYVALLVPQEEARFVTVPPGHSFVFFLDGESGAVVPDGDVLPYDPHDEAKATHPAAVAGVALAQQILQGSSSSSGGATATTIASSSTAGQDGAVSTAAAAASDELQLLSDDEDEDEDVLTMLTSGAAAAAQQQQRRRGGKDVADEQEQRQQRAHADVTRADDDDDDDEQDEAARQRRHRRRQERKQERRRRRAARGDDDGGGSSSSSDDDDTKDKDKDDNDDTAAADRFAQPLDWSTLEEEFATSAQPHGTRRKGRVPRRTHATQPHDEDEDEDAAAGGGVFDDADRALGARTRHGGSSSTAAAALLLPQLAKIRYYYRQLLDEATVQGKLLSHSEADVVRAVEQALVLAHAKAASLQRAAQAQLAAAATATTTTASRRPAATQRIARALQHTLRRLEHDDCDVERLVRGVVRMRADPSVATATANEAMTTLSQQQQLRARARRSEPISTFADASTTFVLERTALTTAPRELTTELANKYREQRTQRERVLAFSQGLGKTGLYSATPRLLERWTRARELMVLAHQQPHENQPVKPVGYVARRFAESLNKVERYALRRLSQATAPGSRHAGGNNSSNNALHTFLAPTTTDLLSAYQSQTRQRQQQAYPAYYSFHDLRPSAVAAATATATATAERDVSLPANTTGNDAASGAHADAYHAEPSLLMALTASTAIAAVDGHGNDNDGNAAAAHDSHAQPLITPLHIAVDGDDANDDDATTRTTTAASAMGGGGSHRDVRAAFAIDAAEAAAAAEVVHNVTASTAYNSLRHRYARTRSSASASYYSNRHATDSAPYEAHDGGDDDEAAANSVLLLPPSASIRMPSQETQFYSAITHASERTTASLSEYGDKDDDHTAASGIQQQQQQQQHSAYRRHRYTAASSRASSLASSVAPSESAMAATDRDKDDDDEDDNDGKNAAVVRSRHARGARTHRRGGSSGHVTRRTADHKDATTAAAAAAATMLPPGAVGAGDWRGSAKRAILEQLTLYLRGLRDKPAVLSRDAFSAVARKLLERAVRRESERTGVSLALQANNTTLPFTRSTAASLKRSVDTYVHRHFIASHRSSNAASDGAGGGAAAETSAPYARVPGTVPLMQPPATMEDEDDDIGGMIMRERSQQLQQQQQQHSVGDSPVYDV